MCVQRDVQKQQQASGYQQYHLAYPDAVAHFVGLLPVGYLFWRVCRIKLDEFFGRMGFTKEII